MTQQVVFIQGIGEGVHDQWDDKLVSSLERELGDGYSVRYPRMPNEGDAKYPEWKTALLGEFSSLEDGAVIVGHSVGGTILLHTLAEQPPLPKLRGIFLIAAPFIGEGGWPSDDIRSRTDFSERLPFGIPVFLYHAIDDDIVPVAHVYLYSKAMLHAVVRTFENGNHQLNNDLSLVARDIRGISP
jgi:predicted alpha/beta hydrolase family esterase